jgi:hypothetical protein
MAKKKECPIQRAEFNEHADALTLELAGQPMLAEPKQFRTGSMGWHAGGKVNLVVNGKTIPVQVGVNLTVIGSKELPEEEGDE